MPETAVTTWRDDTLDKADWGLGLWIDEPDGVQFQDATSGLICAMIRHPHMGNWCGYVGVSAAHPDRGRSHSDLELVLTVHGGLTYSGQSVALMRPLEGPEFPVWWFGFDCAHLGDLSPGYPVFIRKMGVKPRPFEPTETYRDQPYVAKECRKLAAQLAARGRK